MQLRSILLFSAALITLAAAIALAQEMPGAESQA